MVQADVTRASDVESLVEQTVAELGPIDILVNNAGSLVERLKILELTEERWDEVIDLNLKSAFLCCKAVAGSMMERKTGAIINRLFDCRTQWRRAGLNSLLHSKGWADHIYQRSGQRVGAFRGARKCSLTGSD